VRGAEFDGSEPELFQRGKVDGLDRERKEFWGK
jgi:hypothetical protein